MKQLGILTGGTVVVVIALAEILENLHSGALAAFVISLVILGAMVAAVVVYAGQRPVGTPVTWGEAMVGSTFVFIALMTAYGAVPDQWIDLCAYWGWDDPARLVADDAIEPIASIANIFPFNINYIHVRDIVVVLIHAVMFGGTIWIWLFWQNRGEKSVEVEPVSEFGRPLVKEA